MKIFIIGDTHFNHKNIIGYTGRPFKTVEEMNERIIKNWNQAVREDDLVIHLGDFALGSNEEIKNLRKMLRGNIILLRGNHDHKAVRNAGFLILNETIEIDNIIFSHRPLKKEEIPQGCVNVHGHIHEKESLSGINLSVEKTDYAPLELEELKKRINIKK